MAHKKGGGSTSNGRDSNSKRLGIKKFGGEVVASGNIIVRGEVEAVDDAVNHERLCAIQAHSWS